LTIATPLIRAGASMAACSALIDPIEFATRVTGSSPPMTSASKSRSCSLQV